MTQPIFRGWSTNKVTPQNTNINFYDIDIVKQDLINEFMTRKGERVMMPEYGSITWDMLFEPLIESIVSDIIEDSISIIEHDPRIGYSSMNVSGSGDGHSITLNINAIYKPTMTPFNLEVFFDGSTVTDYV